MTDSTRFCKECNEALVRQRGERMNYFTQRYFCDDDCKAAWRTHGPKRFIKKPPNIADVMRDPVNQVVAMRWV